MCKTATPLVDVTHLPAGSKMKLSGVYRLKCVVNGKSYIGSAVNWQVRTRAHLGKLRLGKHINKHLQNAWNKHGEAGFVIEFLEECDRSELEQREQQWINKLQASDPKLGYNQKNAVRQKSPSIALSAIQKSYWERLTPEQLQERMAHVKDKDGRERMRQNVIKQWADDNFRNSMADKVSKTMKAHCANEEVKKQRKAISRAYWDSPEAKEAARLRMQKRWASLSDEERESRLLGLKQRQKRT